MQIKIAFKAIFLVDEGEEYGVEVGKFSRAEPQSAPQNAKSVIGDPAEHNRCGNGNTGCTRVTGRELAGIAASTKQPMAMANINKQHFLEIGSS